MHILRYGVLAQTQASVAARPSQYIQCAANGALRTADNAGDPFNFGAKTDKSFTVAGWFKPKFSFGATPNKYTECFFGHGAEFSYMWRPYLTASSGGWYTTDFNTQQYNFSDDSDWYFFFGNSNDSGNTTLYRVYTTSANVINNTLSTANNPVSDATDYFYLGIPRGRSFWGGTLGGSSKFNAVGVWNRALTSAEADALWNNGAGLSYANLTSGQKTNLVSYWNCDNYNSGTGVVTDNHTNGYSITAQDKTKVSLQTI